jgi:hypothetical protein
MTTEDLIEHIDFVVKHNNPNNYVDVGFLELAEIGRIRQGLVLLARLEQRLAADRSHTNGLTRIDREYADA